MGFKKDLKTGLKKLGGSIKSKFTKEKATKEVNPQIVAEEDRASESIPARLVQLPPSSSTTSSRTPNKLRKRQRPTTSPPTVSPLPSNLTYGVNNSISFSAILTTNDISGDSASDSPKSKSTQSSDSTGVRPSHRAPSMTEAISSEDEKNNSTSQGTNEQKEKHRTTHLQSQSIIAVEGLSEQAFEPIEDDDGFFTPVIPASLQVSPSRPSEFNLRFGNADFANGVFDIDGLSYSPRPAHITTSDTRFDDSQEDGNQLDNHQSSEQATASANIAPSPSTLLSSYSSSLQSSSTLLDQGSSKQQESTNLSLYKYHHTSQESSSQSVATPKKRVSAAANRAARPRSVFKQLIDSRAVALRENEQLLRELEFFSKQIDQERAAAELLVALYNGLGIQAADQHEYIVDLEHELQHAVNQRDGAYNIIHQLQSDLRMVRANNESLVAQTQQLQQTLSDERYELTEVQRESDNLRRSRDWLQQNANNAYGLHAQLAESNQHLGTMRQEKDFAEEDAARWERHCKEAEEERNALAKEKKALEKKNKVLEKGNKQAEAAVGAWKQHCEEAEAQAAEYLAKLNSLRKQIPSTPQRAKKPGNAFSPDNFSDDEEEDDSLPTPAELAEERAYNERRFDAYENHIGDLEEQLAASKLRIQELLADGQCAMHESELPEEEYEDDFAGTSPRTMKNARQCIQVLREQVKAAKDSYASLSGMVVDIQHDLDISETKRKLGLSHLQILQECEPVPVSANYETEPRTHQQRARTSVCQHAVQVVRLTHQLHDLRAEKDTAYEKLQADYKDLKELENRTLTDYLECEIQKTGYKAENERLNKANIHLDNDNRTMRALLHHRVWGPTHGDLAAEQLGALHSRIKELEARVERRNKEIKNLVAALNLYTSPNPITGRLGIVQSLEQNVTTLRIDRAKYQAMVKTLEERFGTQLTRNKLELDLETAESECKGDEGLVKEVRRVDAGMYTLKEGEITTEECFYF